jgi:glucose/arabinose dehydrogenase
VAVAPGLNDPAGFTFHPNNGNIWYLERGTGEVRVISRSTGNDRLFFDISNVDGDGERGALGIALHPKYPNKPYVYVYVTRTDHGTLVNELIRIRMEQNKGVGFQVLFKWPVVATNHNGGRIAFGPDGKLWIVTGENANPAYSQQKSNIRGKILRINADGSIPADNPYGTRVWAYGIRNSFGFAFDPWTGLPWETENGPTCNDEINLIRKAGNYAWGPNQACGSLPAPRDTNQDGADRRLPKYYVVDTIAITGAAFCDGCGLGGGLQGQLLFGGSNYPNGNKIQHLSLNADRTGFVGSVGKVVDVDGVYSMEVAPNGQIYFSNWGGIYRLAAV